MKRAWHICILAALLFVARQSQAEDLKGNLHLMAGVPRGEFASLVSQKGLGVGGDIVYAIPSSPVQVGLSVGFLGYGNEERRVPFSTTIPDVTVNVSTDNNILLGHFLLRLQPQKGIVRPYVDGLVGLKYFFTTTTINDRNGAGHDVASSTNLGDVAFSYGGGGGFTFRVYDNSTDEAAQVKEVSIDLGARYLFGGTAEYLKEGSITRENGVARYSALRSKTDIMTLQVGVSVGF